MRAARFFPTCNAVIMLVLAGSLASGEPAKDKAPVGFPKKVELVTWANNYKFTQGKTTWDSAIKNPIPNELIGSPGKLSAILKYIELDEKFIKMRYQFHNATCVVVPLSEKFDILLFGGTIGEEKQSIYVSKGMLLKKVDGPELKESIENMFE